MASYIQSSSGIYKITNIVDNKIYIGCASNILNIPKYNLSRKLSGKRNNNINLIYL